MIFHLNTEYGTASLEIIGNKMILKKGSRIRMDSLPKFEIKRKTYFKKWKDITNRDVDDNGYLTNDVEVNSRTEATTIVLGGSSPNNNIWKTKDGIPYDEAMNLDVTMESEEDKHDYLMDLLRDIDIFDGIIAETDFNVFETLSIIKSEIRHSNILAWLLNPNETHNLNDFFLKRFVRTIYEQNKNTFHNLLPEQVYLWDYDNTEVYRERNNIDIIVVDHSKKFILVLENKIYSNEHDNQLDKYENRINLEYPDYHKMFVYLTISGDEPSNIKVWARYSYQQILESILDECVKKASIKVKDFLSDYQVALRRYIVKDEKLESICRMIYSKHKKALDLIYEYKPDLLSNLSEHLQDIVSSDGNLIKKHSIKKVVRFSDNILEKINDKYRVHSGKWVKDNSIILFELKIKNDSIYLSTVVGPTIDDSRDIIINHFKSIGNKISSASDGDKWTTLKSIKICDYKEDENIESIIERIDKNISDKLRRQIDDIDSIFNYFI